MNWQRNARLRTRGESREFCHEIGGGGGGGRGFLGEEVGGLGEFAA